MKDPALFSQLEKLMTEQRNPRSMHIDTASIREILETINTEDHLVPVAVRREMDYIEQAVEIVVHAFKSGGRLFYVGAGTSGRLGILDASECPPTFGVSYDLVNGIIAGGEAAIQRAQEGAEDDPAAGMVALEENGVTSRDVICGIAASRRTPFVVGAVQHAKRLGCRTLFVTCNPRSAFDLDVDVAICAEVGPEVLMGSTRMKSGTAQKLVLNMITTTAMIRLGKVYENMMVDLQRTNRKLHERSRRIVMLATGVDYDAASQALEDADGHVKSAIVMVLTNTDLPTATELLQKGDGFVKNALMFKNP